MNIEQFNSPTLNCAVYEDIYKTVHHCTLRVKTIVLLTLLIYTNIIIADTYNELTTWDT